MGVGGCPPAPRHGRTRRHGVGRGAEEVVPGGDRGAVAAATRRCRALARRYERHTCRQQEKLRPHETSGYPGKWADDFYRALLLPLETSEEPVSTPARSRGPLHDKNTQSLRGPLERTVSASEPWPLVGLPLERVDRQAG